MNNLRIRLFDRSDEKDLYPILMDNSLKKYYRGVYCKDGKEIEKIVKSFFYSSNIEVYSIVITEKGNKRMIGFIEAEYDERLDKIFLSYALNPDYRNQGIMTEAVKKVIKNKLKPYFSGTTVCMYILPFNKSSIKIAEKIGAKLSNDVYYELEL